ncbi:MAG: phosphoribosylformylglycinamidine synthase I [Candidatus Cloacimonadota bacterium]|nr:MAG: phosphoribosylformylglycinamidine synthase I [Candidatus Cloacimonadota bacterium]
MRFNIIVFPGSNCDYDTYFVLKNVFHCKVDFIWHKQDKLKNADCVILPGGFSYGDYLRPGAIASFSPIMQELKKFAQRGGLVLGICNGFQMLLEMGLLPGSLMLNNTLSFICRNVYIKVINMHTPFTNTIAEKNVLKIPIAHKEGNYFIDEEKLKELQKNNQIVFQYCDKQGNTTEYTNPNGSVNNIAGIINKNGNVLGMMPHPERASEMILGSDDGKFIFQSIIASTFANHHKI